MSAKAILQQFVNGEREPVQGPLTYLEAFGVVSMNQQLITALRATLAAMPRPEARAGLATYYHACATVVEAEALL